MLTHTFALFSLPVYMFRFRLLLFFIIVHLILKNYFSIRIHFTLYRCSVSTWIKVLIDWLIVVCALVHQADGAAARHAGSDRATEADENGQRNSRSRPTRLAVSWWHPRIEITIKMYLLFGGWWRGVVVSGVRQWTKLTHVGPGYNWYWWPSSSGYAISGCNQPTRSTQPCIPPGSLNRVPASAGVTAGMSPLPGGR